MNCVKETPKDWDKWMKKVGITENYIFINTPKRKRQILVTVRGVKEMSL